MIWLEKFVWIILFFFCTERQTSACKFVCVSVGDHTHLWAYQSRSYNLYTFAMGPFQQDQPFNECLCITVATFFCKFSTRLQTFRAFMGNLKLDEKRVQIGCRIQFNFQICTLKQQTSSSETNCSPAFRFPLLLLLESHIHNQTQPKMRFHVR